jgi:hypothetical protein
MVRTFSETFLSGIGFSGQSLRVGKRTQRLKLPIICDFATRLKPALPGMRPFCQACSPEKVHLEAALAVHPGNGFLGNAVSPRRTSL